MKLTVKEVNLIINSLLDESFEDKDNDAELEALAEKFENLEVDTRDTTSLNSNYFSGVPNVALCSDKLK